MRPDERGKGMRRIAKGILSVIVVVLLGFSSLSATASTAGDDLAREADQLIRNSERNMFNGKVDEAVQLLEQAAAKIEQLKSVDPANSRLRSVESKYDRLKKQLDRKVRQRGYTQTSTSTPTATAKQTGTSKQTAGGKLPAGVSKRLRDINGFLDQADQYAASDAQKAAYKLKQAKSLFEEIDRMYGTQFDKAHPEFSAVKNRFDNITGATAQQAVAEQKAVADARSSEAAKEKQSAEWIPRFQAYLSYAGQEGHDPDKVVFVPGTSETDKFAEAQRRYAAFKDFYATYKQTDFPNGKTWKLENLADEEAPARLSFFEERFADRLSAVAGDAEKQIREAMAQLQRDNGWKSDKSVKPPIIDSKWMATIRESVERAVSGLGGNTKAAGIQQALAELEQADGKNRQLRAERTFLSADVYDGSDAGKLKDKIQSIVEKERPGSKVYRVSIYKEDWKEETVEEWTDSTRTKWRVRTTRQINAQVAAKDRSGVFMHTIHLAKDKQSGGWGGLYGHIMFSEPMSEDNINR